MAARRSEGKPEKLSILGLRAKLGGVAALALAGGVVTWLLITDGVRDIAFSMSFTLMPLYLEDIGGMTIQQIGLLNSVYGIFQMITTIPAGWLADKKGERVTIVFGFLLESVAMLVILQVSSFAGYALAWALFGFGDGLMSPAYQSLISKAVPERLRGTAFGFLHSSLGLFSLPAPAIGGQLWERFGPRTPFTLTAVVAFVTTIPAWLKFKLSKNDEAFTAQEVLVEG